MPATPRTGTVLYTVEELPFRGGLLCVEVEVAYTITAGEPMVWTLRNGDPGYPGTGPEIDRLAFYPHKVTDNDAGDDWTAYDVQLSREDLTAALDAWYAAAPRYALDDAIFDDANTDPREE